jgi:hypothetical protein
LLIWIKRLPHDRQLEDFDLRRYERDHVYDVGTPLAELLIVMGYAGLEMRRVERDTAADGPRRRRSDTKRAP